MALKVSKDCPFTADEIDWLKSILYRVNTSNRCCNAAPVSWVAGYQRWQLKKEARSENPGDNGDELTVWPNGQ